ncbi:MAG: cysteine hydrolase [Alphaproteobacteria bacterium]|uniref:Cysteine hydrolase n=1 Tax=Candidatus Nitrobium versatile TaxID=2884831 RepID=A0A953JCT3_9BACT|nr:cysteine hydrolase [Candidatus Nitrobium versatile]
MAEKALLVADMLNDFVREGAPLRVPDTKRAIPTIKREIQRARKDGIPVIYLCDAHDPDDKEFSRYGWPAHAVKGTEGAQVIKELKPEAGDIIVEKKTYSGFYRTSLDKILKELGVNTVRLTGCVTHICVLFTASEAALRGYSVEVVTGGVAGLAKQDHTAALRIMKNVLGAKLV